MQFLREPAPAEEADKDAQNELETNRRVATNSFPALMHQDCKNAALHYHA